MAGGQNFAPRVWIALLRTRKVYAFLARITIRTFLCSRISQDLTRFMLGFAEDMQLLTA